MNNDRELIFEKYNSIDTTKFCINDKDGVLEAKNKFLETCDDKDKKCINEGMFRVIFKCGHIQNVKCEGYRPTIKSLKNCNTCREIILKYRQSGKTNMLMRDI